MTDATRRFDPAAVVASLRARFGILTDTARRGPVPLARLLDEFNLLHVTLPRLTRAGIAEYLLGEGIMPGTLADSGDPDEMLAGFIFTTGADGFVFVGELELSASEDGQQPKLQPTPIGRRRFTAAHELGHFLLHRDRMIAGRWIGDTKETIREDDGADTADMEREADRFAAELLMPADVCRARAEAFKAAYRVCPLTTFAYHLSSELVSPEALRYRLRGLAEVGGIALRRKGRELHRDFFGLERVVSFITDPFPWPEVEALAGAIVNLPEFPLRVLPASRPEVDDPIEFFDYEKMRKAAQNRANNEMANWEAVAPAADRQTPALVDGRLEPRLRSAAAADRFALVVGIVKTHSANLLHPQGWRTLLDLKQGDERSQRCAHRCDPRPGHRPP